MKAKHWFSLIGLALFMLGLIMTSGGWMLTGCIFFALVIFEDIIDGKD